MPSEIKSEIKSVFGIIFSEDQKSMVMVKRRDFPLWVFPGGGMEEEESPEKACLRELEEETGFRCRIIRKVCDFDHKKVMKVRSSLFVCQVVSGQAKLSNEAMKVSFFPIAEPPKLFLPIFKEFLDISLAGTKQNNLILKSITWANAIKFLFNHPLISIRFLFTRIGLHFNSR